MLIQCKGEHLSFFIKASDSRPTVGSNESILLYCFLLICVKKYTGLKFVDLIFEDDLFYFPLKGFAKEWGIFTFALNEIFGD